MIRRLLIANRGEIAIRVARTAREMGIRTVGVYSHVDRGALHLQATDESVEIGGSAPRDSYLNLGAILRAARRTRVDAVHPGYGFLSENPEFAARCKEEGFLFVGPNPKAMALSGDKIASRKAMADAGVAVTPGVNHIVSDAEEASEVARGLGYPVMFKATAGGGGIGMSRVDRPRDLPKAFESARSVALANFGNPALFLEKYIPRARHIEVQVLLARRGAGVHLWERECSVQRRHQKLIEETPSPVLTATQRRKLCDSALRGMRQMGYTNAGTAEFLYHRGRFTFNEINARLQVEHPVTESVTGVDLVRQQILIAAGEGLEISQNEVVRSGHGMECRINAEDPLRNFLPSPGRVARFRQPAGPGVRVDSGVDQGSVVPPYYDSLIAKLIVRGRSRAEALRRMERGLREFEVRGVNTTIPFHQAVLQDPSFRRGTLWTTMVSDLKIAERMRGRGPWEEQVAALAAALVGGGRLDRIRAGRPLETLPVPGWARAGRTERLAGGGDAVPSRGRW